MAPLIIAALGAGAAALGAYVYEKHKGGGGAPWGGWSQPPAVPGYSPVPMPPGTPPSWGYQGPQVPPATTPTNTVESISLAPGTMTSRPHAGDTVIMSLPANATWVSANVPTCIGGDLTGATPGGADPLSLSSVAGAGTAQLLWLDGTGAQQQTLLDINVGA